MAKKKTFMYVLKRVREGFREEGFLGTLLRSMDVVGVQISPFYYIKEVLPPEIPLSLTALPEGFEFSIFDLNDVMAIGNLSDRIYGDPENFIDCFNRGEMCFGIKYNGQIVAYSWISFKKCVSKLYQAAMKENEAYFHDMYVLKAFRGKNLAPILRYKNYEVLKDMGRNTFYSITEFFNAASFRFKQKLNAKVVFLGLYIELFKRYHGRCVLKKY